MCSLAPKYTNISGRTVHKFKSSVSENLIRFPIRKERIGNYSNWNHNSNENIRLKESHKLVRPTTERIGTQITNQGWLQPVVISLTEWEINALTGAYCCCSTQLIENKLHATHFTG